MEPGLRRADPILLDFDYEPSLTLTAADTFNHRTGNCLSFTAMFIAMAREAGLKAWFQEVKLPPEWSSVNDTFLVSMHVNAVVQDCLFAPKTAPGFALKIAPP